MELKKLKVSGKGTELGVHQSGFLAPLLPQSKLCTKTQLPTSAWVQLYSCVDGCGHSYTQTSPILCLGHHCEFTVGKLIKHRVVRYSLGYSRVYGLPKRLSGKKTHLPCGRPGFHPWVGKIPLRRKWQPTPVFWPGEIPWTAEPGRLHPAHRVTRESDMT